MGDIRDLAGVQSANLKNRKVLLRVDVNVPIEAGVVRDRTRIKRIIPTVEYLVQRGAKVLIISHLGRPKQRDKELSLGQLRGVIAEELGRDVVFIADICDPTVPSVVDKLPWGAVVLLENLRFYAGEVANSAAFARALASLADLYVNDAFSCSHRLHASVSAVSDILESFVGFNLQEELKYLSGITSERPAAAVIGGAKAATKIPMLGNLAGKIDFLILGGGLANSFLAAAGYKVGSSLYEQKQQEVIEVMEVAKRSGCELILPKDHVVATSLDGVSSARTNCEIAPEDMILDVGEQTAQVIEKTLSKCRTVFWNGPLGVFEKEAFSQGTAALLKALSTRHKACNTQTIVGGGDSIFAMRSLGYREDDFTYVSTGGGALLHFLSIA
ncbi:bifunctional PGK/TIM [Anaplasma platys]|uniref:Phosphoglycerate kinase n=1 Tax=Anaplasma platys TaxID=949 RepID=A0A858PX59_9RICK|nr:phosphoglycerate kinase [Anaplasma platys]QJC27173.1 bifunctional PGK/TIM [Anaplasma platys]